mgnify:FL=1
MTEVIEKTEYKKGYKKTKLGWVPEDWKMVRFNELFDEVVNLSNDTETYPLYSLTLENGVTPKTERYERSHLLKDKNENEFKLISEGEIAINPMNLRFGAFFMSKVPETVSLSAYYDIVKAKKDTVNVIFYDAFMKSASARRLYQRIATGSLDEKKRIHLSELKKQLVPYPKKEEQDKIAEILSTWDDGIETLEKLIEQKEILKNSLAQKCFRRKNILFSLKQHKLGELFKNRKETNCCDLELLSVCNGLGIVPRSQLNAKDNSNDNKSKYLKVCIGDLAYNTMRMWQGRCGVSSYEGIVSPAYTVCIPKNNIDVDYMYYLFKTPHMIHDFWRYSQGIVDDTLNLKFNNFEVIKVWIPDKETQTKIAKLLKSYDEEIQLLNSKLEKLEEQKKGLMQKLLTGQIRVKV